MPFFLPKLRTSLLLLLLYLLPSVLLFSPKLWERERGGEERKGNGPSVGQGRRKEKKQVSFKTPSNFAQQAASLSFLLKGLLDGAVLRVRHSLPPFLEHFFFSRKRETTANMSVICRHAVTPLLLSFPSFSQREKRRRRESPHFLQHAKKWWAFLLHPPILPAVLPSSPSRVVLLHE